MENYLLRCCQEYRAWHNKKPKIYLSKNAYYYLFEIFFNKTREFNCIETISMKTEFSGFKIIIDENIEYGWYIK